MKKKVVTLIIAQALGCYLMASEYILTSQFIFNQEEELKLYIPNAFTPNLDGNNDYFEVITNEVFDFEITIYDKRGNRIFYSNDLKFKWNGKYKDSDCLAGVYIYVIRGRISKQGTLTLIR